MLFVYHLTIALILTFLWIMSLFFLPFYIYHWISAFASISASWQDQTTMFKQEWLSKAKLLCLCFKPNQNKQNINIRWIILDFGRSNCTSTTSGHKKYTQNGINKGWFHSCPDFLQEVWQSCQVILLNKTNLDFMYIYTNIFQPVSSCYQQW